MWKMPATYRHGLPVIAGPGPAQGHGDRVPVGQTQDLDHFGFTFRTHDEIGGHMLHPRFQDRRVPEEVTAFGPHRDRAVVNLKMAQRGFQGVDGHGNRIRSSSSA